MFIAGRGVRNPGFHTRKGNHKISYFCIKTNKIYLHVYLFYGGGREEDSHSSLLYSVRVSVDRLLTSKLYKLYKR